MFLSPVPSPSCVQYLFVFVTYFAVAVLPVIGGPRIRGWRAGGGPPGGGLGDLPPGHARNKPVVRQRSTFSPCESVCGTPDPPTNSPCGTTWSRCPAPLELSGPVPEPRGVGLPGDPARWQVRRGHARSPPGGPRSDRAGSSRGRGRGGAQSGRCGLCRE